MLDIELMLIYCKRYCEDNAPGCDSIPMAKELFTLYQRNDALTGEFGLRRMLGEKYADYFCKAYLSDQFNKPMGNYAIEMMNDVQSVLHGKKSYKMARVAPRSFGKSTIMTFGMTTYAACYKLRQYILFLSSSDDISSNFLGKVKNALESPDIIEDFGLQKDPNAVWNAAEVKTISGVIIEANGWTSGLRGKNKTRRPDWVLFDDLEDKKTVEAPSMRDKLNKSFDEEMMRLGDVDTFYLYVGTFIAPDSLLVRVTQRALWNTKIYKKVLSFAANENLWEEWRRIIRDMSVSQDDRLDCAYDFYLKNKEDMLAGTKMLWDAQYPDESMKYPGAYYNTMLIREDGGEGGENAFWQEDQNEPKGTSNLAFKDIKTWDEFPEDLTKLKLAVDPSQGKSDPAAYAVGGTINGALFVKDGLLAPHGSSQTIDQIVWFIKKYSGIEEIILESNLFKDILKTQLEERLKAEKDENGNSCYRHIDNHYAGENKHIRIMKMEPDAASGKILLNPYNTGFNNNVREYHAKSAHDDAPDVLQALWSKTMSGASAYAEYARLQAEKIRGVKQ